MASIVTVFLVADFLLLCFFSSFWLLLLLRLKWNLSFYFCCNHHPLFLLCALLLQWRHGRWDYNYIIITIFFIIIYYFFISSFKSYDDVTTFFFRSISTTSYMTLSDTAMEKVTGMFRWRYFLLISIFSDYLQML